MIFRKAKPTDIPTIQFVSYTVKENILSDPALVTDSNWNKKVITAPL